ncbi:MAG: phosphodiester glycosidase family protein, partial [Oscillospiraceae bacterium]|nr:phosphodiester glycosidase family protein [Oscillospiraceae bacterium]
RLTALGLVLSLMFSTAWATAGEQKLRTSIQLVDGLTYRNTITENGGNRIESFSFELSSDSRATAILLQGDETIYGGGSITQAVATARAQGYHVLGAVNTDFFSVTNGVPMGLVIEDGVYKSSNYLENAMTIGPDGISLVENPKVSLSLYNHTNGITVIPDHLNKLRNSGGGIYLLNSDFSTVSTRSDGAGWYVRLKLTDEEPPAPVTPPPEETASPEPVTTEPVVEPTAFPEESPAPLTETPQPFEEQPEMPSEAAQAPEMPSEESPQERPEVTDEPEPEPSVTPDAAPEETAAPAEGEKEREEKLRVNGTLEFVVVEVTRAETSLPMAPDEYILTAVEQYRGDIFETFQVGDRITLTTACEDPVLSKTQWACGVGDIMVKNGEVTDSSTWTYHNDGRQPRTAMGLKPDGTLILYAVDGRRAGYSHGLTQMDLTTELQRQG